MIVLCIALLLKSSIQNWNKVWLLHFLFGTYIAVWLVSVGLDRLQLFTVCFEIFFHSIEFLSSCVYLDDVSMKNRQSISLYIWGWNRNGWKCSWLFWLNRTFWYCTAEWADAKENGMFDCLIFVPNLCTLSITLFMTHIYLSSYLYP